MAKDTKKKIKEDLFNKQEDVLNYNEVIDEPQISQCERFIQGVKKLANECGFSFSKFGNFSIDTIHFEDGSYVGILALAYHCGLVSRDVYEHWKEAAKNLKKLK